jgi:hypothetical protein
MQVEDLLQAIIDDHVYIYDEMSPVEGDVPRMVISRYGEGFRVVDSASIGDDGFSPEYYCSSYQELQALVDRLLPVGFQGGFSGENFG